MRIRLYLYAALFLPLIVTTVPIAGANEDGSSGKQPAGSDESTLNRERIGLVPVSYTHLTLPTILLV